MAHIVINDTTPRASFTVGGTPSLGPFEIDFAVLEPSTDLKVYDDGALLTYSAAPTLATQWGWVATNPVDGGHQGGEVILGGTVTNSTILVTRDIPIARTSDFPYPSGTFNIQAFNTQLDRLYAIAQDRESALSRVLRQPDSDVDLIDPLPAADDRANMFFAFDADGNPTVAVGVSSGGSPISSYMDGLLTSANEAALKAAMNAEAGTDFLAPAGNGSSLTHLAFGHSMALSNGKLAWSVSGNALTIAVKTLADADPTAAAPVKIAIPDGSGGVNVRTLTGALSLTISSGSTLGTSNSVAFRIWIGALDNGGTVELFAVNCRNGTDILPLDEGDVISTTAEGGAGAADSAHVPYSASARTSKYYRVLGYGTWNSGLGAVGTWSAGPSVAVLMGPGIKKPGDVVQTVRGSYGTYGSSTNTVPADDTIPQQGGSEGVETVTKAITPRSGANILDVEVAWNARSNSANGFTVGSLYRDSTASAVRSQTVAHGSGNNGGGQIRYKELAGAVTATTFKLRVGPDAGTLTTIYFNGSTSARLYGGALSHDMDITELMA